MSLASHAIASVALALLVAAAGCSSSPVAPTTTALAGIDLTGTWTGTKTIHWDPMDGGGACTAQVVATLSQTGTTVRGTLEDTGGDCPGVIRLAAVSGAVKEPWLYLTMGPAPERTVMARIETGTLIANSLNEHWELRR